MSKIELVINDLEVLERACGHLNMEYSKDKAKFRGRGVSVRSKALAVIAVPGAKKVISVLAEGESAFVLRSRLYDNDQDLKTITSAVGALKQRYAVERILAEARKKRMRIQETATETGVRLVLTAY
jgi:hypothetical protein